MKLLGLRRQLGLGQECSVKGFGLDVVVWVSGFHVASQLEV